LSEGDQTIRMGGSEVCRGRGRQGRGRSNGLPAGLGGTGGVGTFSAVNADSYEADGTVIGRSITAAPA
jgi:hypothetical protein